jgi:hypothetical protein
MLRFNAQILLLADAVVAPLSAFCGHPPPPPLPLAPDLVAPGGQVWALINDLPDLPVPSRCVCVRACLCVHVCSHTFIIYSRQPMADCLKRLPRPFFSNGSPPDGYAKGPAKENNIHQSVTGGGGGRQGQVVILDPQKWRGSMGGEGMYGGVWTAGRTSEKHSIS